MPAPNPQTSRTTSTSSTSRRLQEDDDARPYIIVSEIDKGSFATVYKGYHELSHHQVAIKAVRSEGLKQKLLDNLQMEIEILKSLSHRHITKLIDIVRAERYIYLIMEYCAGGNLSSYIKKRGRVEGLEYSPSPGAALQYYPHPKTGGLDEIVVRSFLRQLARALKFLRHRNLIHRDIKPQNLLLNPASPEELAKGHPIGVPILKVADFGFARSLPNAMMAETLCGSPLYMAPEILRYEKYDAKADLWSVGAVLYEMSVGKPPFRAANHVELLRKIEASRGIRFPDEEASSRSAATNGAVRDDASSPNQVQVVPSDIKKLIRMLLKRQPAERASFEDFFKSTALARSKFPRPDAVSQEPSTSGVSMLQTPITPNTPNKSSAPPEDEPEVQEGGIPAGHRIIPPEVLDPKVLMPPSKFHFRRRSSEQKATEGQTQGQPHDRNTEPEPDGQPHDRQEKPTRQEVRRKLKPLSSEGSIIPGESEEDGLLRREYVLVGDVRALEVDRAAEELGNGRRRPLHQRIVTSPVTTTSPTSGAFPNSPTLAAATHAPVSSSPLTAPPLTHATTLPRTTPTTFPPPPNPTSSSPPNLIPSSSPTSALSRALGLAYRKLLGTSTPRYPAPGRAADDGAAQGMYRTPSGEPRRRPILVRSPLEASESEREGDRVNGEGVIVGSGSGGENGEDEKAGGAGEAQDDEAWSAKGKEQESGEEALLAWLENLAQKTDVLAHWADEMYEFVKAVPQKPLPDPSTGGARAMKQAEQAVTCIAVYILLMSFAQRGIDKLVAYRQQLIADGGGNVSDGFRDALTWFKEQFIRCNDRATLVKTWLPMQYDGPKMWVDQLVYDRALMLSRTAARKELTDQASKPDECEKLYEESLWCLYALQDELQSGNDFAEDDRKTIVTWITRTKLRLVRCRARMNMTDKERMRDALADQNLVDARYPPPWDLQAIDEMERQQRQRAPASPNGR